jgi:hypothetical protein
MKSIALAFATVVGLCLVPATAQVRQEHTVCIGDNDQICRKRFPDLNVEKYLCGLPPTNRAICFAYCGAPDTSRLCSVTALTDQENGGQCGYRWVNVRCY